MLDHVHCLWEFEWDEAKETHNLQRHGVDFDEAASSFYGPLTLVQSDERHSHGEHRFVLPGRSRPGRMLVTIFAERGQTLRIISSRCATRREVGAHEEGV